MIETQTIKPLPKDIEGILAGPYPNLRDVTPRIIVTRKPIAGSVEVKCNGYCDEKYYVSKAYLDKEGRLPKNMSAGFIDGDNILRELYISESGVLYCNRGNCFNLYTED